MKILEKLKSIFCKNKLDRQPTTIISVCRRNDKGAWVIIEEVEICGYEKNIIVSDHIDIKNCDGNNQLLITSHYGYVVKLLINGKIDAMSVVNKQLAQEHNNA